VKKADSVNRAVPQTPESTHLRNFRATLVVCILTDVSIANYAEAAILDAVFNNTSFAVATPYVKLHTGDPGEACTDNAATETTRKLLSCGAASGGACSSDGDLTWASVAADETYSHVSVWDHVSAGNALWSGALTTPKTVELGDTFTIPSGDLDITLD
jgi:hypothetical protein